VTILSSENNRQALGRELGQYVYNPKVVFQALEGFCEGDAARLQAAFEQLVFLRLLVVTTVTSTRYKPEEGMPVLDAAMGTILSLADAPMNAACRFDFLAGYTRIMPTYFARIQQAGAYDPESFVRAAAANFAELCGPRDHPLLLLAASGIGTWIVDVNRFYDEAESGELVFEGMDPPGGQG
jgi:hypothetical protein